MSISTQLAIFLFGFMRVDTSSKVGDCFSYLVLDGKFLSCIYHLNLLLKNSEIKSWTWSLTRLGFTSVTELGSNLLKVIYQTRHHKTNQAPESQGLVPKVNTHFPHALIQKIGVHES